MNEQNLREIYKEYFFCINLYNFILNQLSLFLSYRYDQNNVNKLDEYREDINEMLQHTNIDNQEFSDLLEDFIKQYLEHKNEEDLTLEQMFQREVERERTPIETYLLNYIEELKEELRKIPSSLDKAENLLLSLISAYDPRYYSDQVYDAIILLKEEIPPETIENILKDWKDEVIHYLRRSGGLFRFSKIFWNSDVEYGILDMISRYRFKELFNIGKFEFAFEEVEKQLEDFILDTRGTTGSFNFWLISRSNELSYKLAGIDITLKEYVKNQHEDGYWINNSRLDFKGPNIFTTLLNTLSLLKLSPSKQLRQLGIKGARWIQTQQNSDGSWSYQFRREGEIKTEKKVFTTILCLEVLKRSGLENTEQIIQKGEKWIITQQDEIDGWTDDFLPFPFLTVLVLEYFYNKDLFSRQLPLFQNELTPANIIFLGMKKSIELSKKCESEENRISPKVGVVVIKDDQIVLEAYRGETSPGDHAEYIAIKKKGEDFNFEDSILITTLEPCTIRSLNKTPCAKRIVNAGIKNVWVGMFDPNPQITGRGILYLAKHGVSVGHFPPSLSKEIRDINNDFWDDKTKNYYEKQSNSQIDIMAVNEEKRI